MQERERQCVSFALWICNFLNFCVTVHLCVCVCLCVDVCVRERETDSQKTFQGLSRVVRFENKSCKKSK